MDYAESIVLTKYVWDHYPSLRSDEEHLISKAIFAKLKAASAQSERMAARVRAKWGEDDNLVVQAALSDGIDEYRNRVRNRVLADHAEQVFINRCPNCNRIVHTPLAQQCLWCGNEWYGEPLPSDEVG